MPQDRPCGRLLFAVAVVDVDVVFTLAHHQEWSPWSQDMLQYLWSGRIPHEKIKRNGSTRHNFTIDTSYTSNKKINVNLAYDTILMHQIHTSRWGALNCVPELNCHVLSTAVYKLEPVHNSSSVQCATEPSLAARALYLASRSVYS